MRLKPNKDYKYGRRKAFKVKFVDDVALLELGQSLGLLEDHIPAKVKDVAHLLLGKGTVEQRALDIIASRVEDLLWAVGVTEACTISADPSEEDSFICKTDSTNEVYYLSPSTRVFKITYGNESKIYNHYSCLPSSVWLAFSVHTDDQTKNEVIRRHGSSLCEFHVYSGNYALHISLDSAIEHEEELTLDKESEFLQYLLGLVPPFDVTEVYRRLNEHLSNTSGIYDIGIQNTIEEKDKDDGKDKETITTDAIRIVHGEVTRFMVTRNGKTVQLTRSGWEVKDDKHTIVQNENGDVNYYFHGIRMSAAISSLAQSQIDAAYQEVELVRELKKKTFLENEDV